jgi:tetratricopeptide (TPR) repeat protein
VALGRGDIDQAVALADASIAHPQASTRCRAISRLVRARALAAGSAKDSEVIEAYEDAFVALATHGHRQLARAYQSYFEALGARGRSAEAILAAKKTLELLGPTLN